MKSQDGTWKTLEKQLNKSKNNIIFFKNESVDDGTLNELQISDKSVLGSIVKNTSGIIIDNWVRILGTGTNERRGIIEYNDFKQGKATTVDKMLIIADDVVGGMFALNTSKFPDDIGLVWYFAPDTLMWESLGIKYSEFISWVLGEKVSDFYKTMRWSSWEKDSKAIDFNESILIYPFLWSKEIEIETASKKKVTTSELFMLNQDYAVKLSQT